jgi:hypothetical protein
LLCRAKPVSFTVSAYPPKLLRRSGTGEEVGHERNNSEQKQQVNQAAGDVKHQKAAQPQNKQ